MHLIGLHGIGQGLRPVNIGDPHEGLSARVKSMPAAASLRASQLWPLQ
jgi:hypothetical protein